MDTSQDLLQEKTLVIIDFTFFIFIFLAELFRGMLFKWKGENKKSHQK